ncbi:hypothetical protein AAMO2058_000539300 [Amorphochlora amoebiformis]
MAVNWPLAAVFAVATGGSAAPAGEGLNNPHRMGSHSKLSEKDAAMFQGDSVFAELGKTVCAAGCIPRKEFYESWEVAHRVHAQFEEYRRFVDLAAGHGLLSYMLLMLDPHGNRTALCIDTVMPPSAVKLHTTFVQRHPNLGPRHRYVTGNMAQLNGADDSVLVSVHACGGLTDLVLSMAINASAPLAVVPCCHSLKMPRPRSPKRHLIFTSENRDKFVHTFGLTDGIDNFREDTLKSYGYSVTSERIPKTITEKNRLIMAEKPRRIHGEFSESLPENYRKPKEFSTSLRTLWPRPELPRQLWSRCEIKLFFNIVDFVGWAPMGRRSWGAFRVKLEAVLCGWVGFSIASSILPCCKSYPTTINGPTAHIETATNVSSTHAAHARTYGPYYNGTRGHTTGEVIRHLHFGNTYHLGRPLGMNQTDPNYNMSLPLRNNGANILLGSVGPGGALPNLTCAFPGYDDYSFTVWPPIGKSGGVFDSGEFNLTIRNISLDLSPHCACFYLWGSVAIIDVTIILPQTITSPNPMPTSGLLVPPSQHAFLTNVQLTRAQYIPISTTPPSVDNSSWRSSGTIYVDVNASLSIKDSVFHGLMLLETSNHTSSELAFIHARPNSFLTLRRINVTAFSALNLNANTSVRHSLGPEPEPFCTASNATLIRAHAAYVAIEASRFEHWTCASILQSNKGTTTVSDTIFANGDPQSYHAELQGEKLKFSLQVVDSDHLTVTGSEFLNVTAALGIVRSHTVIVGSNFQANMIALEVDGHRETTSTPNTTVTIQASNFTNSRPGPGADTGRVWSSIVSLGAVSLLVEGSVFRNNSGLSILMALDDIRTHPNRHSGVENDDGYGSKSSKSSVEQETSVGVGNGVGVGVGVGVVDECLENPLTITETTFQHNHGVVHFGVELYLSFQSCSFFPTLKILSSSFEGKYHLTTNPDARPIVRDSGALELQHAKLNMSNTTVKNYGVTAIKIKGKSAKVAACSGECHSIIVDSQFENNGHHLASGGDLFSNLPAYIDRCHFSHSFGFEGNSVYFLIEALPLQSYVGIAPGIRIANSQFRNLGTETWSTDGGAIMVKRIALEALFKLDFFTVENCHFQNNIVSSRGGDIMVDVFFSGYLSCAVMQAKVITIRNSSFYNSKASAGGSVYVIAQNCGEGKSSKVVLNVQGSRWVSVNALLPGKSNLGVGGAIFLHGTAFDIEGSYFDRNSGIRAGDLYLQSSFGKITNSHFSSSSSYVSGGSIFASNTSPLDPKFSYTISDCTFSRQYATEGGIITSDGGVKISNSRISGLISDTVFFISDFAPIVITNSYIHDGKGSILGCARTCQVSMEGVEVARMESSSYSFISANSRTYGWYIAIVRSKFTDLSSNSGLMSLEGGKVIAVISDSEMSWPRVLESNTQYPFIFNVYDSLLMVKNCRLHGNLSTQNRSGDTEDASRLNTPYIQILGHLSNVLFENSSFLHFETTDKASPPFVDIHAGILEFRFCNITHSNYAHLISAKSSGSVFIRNSQFSHISGGFLHLLDDSYAELSGIDFRNSATRKPHYILITGGGSLSINAMCIRSISMKGSTGSFISVKPQTSLACDIGAVVKVHDLDFTQCDGSFFASGYHAGRSAKAQLKSAPAAPTAYETDLDIVDSVFKHNFAWYGVVSIGGGQSRVKVSRSAFLFNQGLPGPISVVSDSSVTVNSSWFKNNIALNFGGAIFVANKLNGNMSTNNSSQLLVFNSSFENNQGYACGGAIYAKDWNFLSVDRCTFVGNGAGLMISAANDAYESSFAGGGAIALQSLAAGHVSNTTFERNQANKTGGAILILNRGPLPQTLPQTLNPRSPLVLNSSKFVNNSAIYGAGGAIFWDYGDSKPVIDPSTRFATNSAIQGSRISSSVHSLEWTHSIEQLYMVPQSRQKLSAFPKLVLQAKDYYGNPYSVGIESVGLAFSRLKIDTAVLPDLPVSIPNGTGISCFGTSCQQRPGSSSEFVLYGPPNMTIQAFGFVYPRLPTARVTSTNISMAFDGCPPGQEPIYVSAYESKWGRWVCDLCFPGRYNPGTWKVCKKCPAGTYATSGASECKLCRDIGGYAPDPRSTHCLPCTSSEVPNNDGTSCYACPSHSTRSDAIRCECKPNYFFIQADTLAPRLDPSGLQTECIECPKGGICNGSADVFVQPQKGYWHDKWSSSLKFIECRNHACTGGHRETCEEGYRDDGVLCSECDTGWSRTGTYECAQCFGFGVDFIMIMSAYLVTFLVVFAVSYTIIKQGERYLDSLISPGEVDADGNSTLGADPSSRQGTLVKICLTTLQISGILATFTNLWEHSAVFSIVHIQGLLGNTLYNLLSVECLMTHTNDSFWRPVYIDTLLVALQPLVVCPILAILIAAIMTRGCPWICGWPFRMCSEGPASRSSEGLVGEEKVYQRIRDGEKEVEDAGIEDSLEDAGIGHTVEDAVIGDTVEDAGIVNAVEDAVNEHGLEDGVIGNDKKNGTWPALDSKVSNSRFRFKSSQGKPPFMSLAVASSSSINSTRPTSTSKPPEPTRQLRLISETASNSQPTIYGSRQSHSWGPRALSALLTSIQNVYPALLLKAFALFQCQKLSSSDDSYVLVSDMTQRCYEGAHLVFVAGVGVPMVVLYAIGIPLVCALVLVLRKKNIPYFWDSPHSQVEFKQSECFDGNTSTDRLVFSLRRRRRRMEFRRRQEAIALFFLYSDYNKHYYYFEILIMAKKLAIVVVAVFISSEIHQSTNPKIKQPYLEPMHAYLWN